MSSDEDEEMIENLSREKKNKLIELDNIDRKMRKLTKKLYKYSMYGEIEMLLPMTNKGLHEVV